MTRVAHLCELAPRCRPLSPRMEQQHTQHAVDQFRDENEASDDFCSVCCHGGELLCCDGCPCVFHLKCLDPPMERPPSTTDKWLCPLCKSLVSLKSHHWSSSLLQDPVPHPTVDENALPARFRQRPSKCQLHSAYWRQKFLTRPRLHEQSTSESGTASSFEEVDEVDSGESGGESPESEHRLHCCKCKVECTEESSEEDSAFLCCSLCPAVFHRRCLECMAYFLPPDTAGFPKQWTCPLCVCVRRSLFSGKCLSFWHLSVQLHDGGPDARSIQRLLAVRETTRAERDAELRDQREVATSLLSCIKALILFTHTQACCRNMGPSLAAFFRAIAFKRRDVLAELGDRLTHARPLPSAKTSRRIILDDDTDVDRSGSSRLGVRTTSPRPCVHLWSRSIRCPLLPAGALPAATTRMPVRRLLRHPAAAVAMQRLGVTPTQAAAAQRGLVSAPSRPSAGIARTRAAGVPAARATMRYRCLTLHQG